MQAQNSFTDFLVSLYTNIFPRQDAFFCWSQHYFSESNHTMWSILQCKQIPPLDRKSINLFRQFRNHIDFPVGKPCFEAGSAALVPKSPPSRKHSNSKGPPPNHRWAPPEQTRTSRKSVANRKHLWGSTETRSRYFTNSSMREFSWKTNYKQPEHSRKHVNILWHFLNTLFVWKNFSSFVECVFVLFASCLDDVVYLQCKLPPTGIQWQQASCTKFPHCSRNRKIPFGIFITHGNCAPSPPGWIWCWPLIPLIVVVVYFSEVMYPGLNDVNDCCAAYPPPEANHHYWEPSIAFTFRRIERHTTLSSGGDSGGR